MLCLQNYRGRRRGRFARDTVPVTAPAARRVGARATRGSSPAAVRDRAEIANPLRCVAARGWLTGPKPPTARAEIAEARGGAAGPRDRAVARGRAGAGAGRDLARPMRLTTTAGAASGAVRTA